MTIRLNLDLLGPFRLRAETELTLSSRKAQALIAYLAVPVGQAHSRDKLAALLWGDHGDQAARHSLRQTLSSIRKAMESAGIEPLTATADAIALSPSAAEVDVDRLERLAAEGTSEALAEATALYRGDLLEGIRVSEPQFEEWLTFERGRLRELARHACLKLFDLQTQAAEFELATETGRRLLTFDPLHEEIHRALMRLYAASGQRGPALQQYETCRRVLAEELDLEPDEETEQLLRDIRQLRLEELSRLIAAPEPTETATESRPEPAPAAMAIAPAVAAAQSDLPLPDKPSITVLPFRNLGGDPAQEYFSDGITEDIITELSRFRSIFVIARNSSFAYKGKSMKVQDVGRELGVAWVVEGGIRKAGQRLRITARLVEATTGKDMWSERYDCDLEEILTVQDEITRTIAATVRGRVEAAGRQYASRIDDAHLRVYDYILRGQALYNLVSKEAHVEASDLLEKAIELDPQSARAHMLLGAIREMEYWTGWSADPERSLDLARELGEKALVLDDTDSWTHAHMGEIFLHRQEYQDAEIHFERALELNPNDIAARSLYGTFLTSMGRVEEALEQFAIAKRLDPFELLWIPWLRGSTLFTARRYDEAIVALKQIPTPINNVRGWLAACYAQAGRLKEARAALSTFLDVAKTELAVVPQSSEEWVAFWRRDTGYHNEKDFEHFLDGLRRAGLPVEGAAGAREAEGAALASADAEPHLQLPDKPSIAVRPFENVNGDPQQEYFSAGITADIITGLSQLRSLFVIAPSTSFTLRGQSASVQQLATQLGVRYVLDGSVRKAENRLHVTAQLSDASTDEQVWTSQFDGKIKDVLALEAELTESVAGVIAPERGAGETSQAKSKSPNNMEAWDLCQQGIWHQYRSTEKDLAKALELFRRAAELDPDLVRALAGLVDVQYQRVIRGLTDCAAQCREEAIATARRAVELEPKNAAARCALGTAHIMRREHDAAISELESSVELNPSFAWAHYGLGAAYVFAGDARQAIPHLESAIRLSPRDQHMGSFLARMADAQLLLRQYDEAAEWARKALRQPMFEWSRYATLLSALGHLGRLDEAQQTLNDLLRHKQDFTLDFVRQTHLFTGQVALEFVNETQLFTDQDEFAHYLDGIRKAGVAS